MSGNRPFGGFGGKKIRFEENARTGSHILVKAADMFDNQANCPVEMRAVVRFSLDQRNARVGVGDTHPVLIQWRTTIRKKICLYGSSCVKSCPDLVGV